MITVYNWNVKRSGSGMTLRGVGADAKPVLLAEIDAIAAGHIEVYAYKKNEVVAILKKSIMVLIEDKES